MPSRHAEVDLQDWQMRSPGQVLKKSVRHIKQARFFFSYERSDFGLEFFVELLMRG